ncbi:integrator complex subunit 12 isoform X2 [Protopterus annectens]|nr:integrator complex subunit 12 isoform X2 [Protopterus annectens]XP_043917242.1 integrator complex subunit 12 isoform X2 [Protopterus annectens]
MALSLNLELDPIFLKALGYLHSKSKDSAEKLKALLDESLARGNDFTSRPPQKEPELPKVPVAKASSIKQESKPPTLSNNNGKAAGTEKVKKEAEKRPAEKLKTESPEGVEPQKKLKLDKPENQSSPITVQTNKDLPISDLSNFEETSAEDFAMEMGLACVVCRQMMVTSGNQLVECQECHNLYHQECHKPQVTDKDVNDPRLVWYCARCTRQMKRMAQKTQKPPQKTSPSLISAVPAVKDPLVKKPEIKLKQETPTTFQAFKRTEVKPPANASGNSSSSSLVSAASTSGLTGWAAFGAKTSTAPSTTKLGTAVQSIQSTSGKNSVPPAGQKPLGLSGLATPKVVPVSKGTSNNNTSTVSLKPPPSLTLGKPGLNRSSSSDNVSKVGQSASNSSGSNNQTSTGNGGSTVAGSSGNNGAKPASAEQSSSAPKGPTSQESQLNAMKRLQMVKKKAAQKKLRR